LKVGLIFLGAP